MWKQALQFGTTKWYIQDPPESIGEGMYSIVYKVSIDSKGIDSNYAMQIRGIPHSENFREIYSKYQNYGLVVPILDEWMLGEVPVMVFPMLDERLRGMIDWNLSVEDWFEVGKAIIRLMDVLHTNVKYIHPDLTPNNLMVKKVDEVLPLPWIVYFTISKGTYRMYLIDVDDSKPLNQATPDEIEQQDLVILSVYDGIDKFDRIADAINQLLHKKGLDKRELQIFEIIVRCITSTAKQYNITIDDVYKSISSYY